jgi:hypothetical protein
MNADATVTKLPSSTDLELTFLTLTPLFLASFIIH